MKVLIAAASFTLWIVSPGVQTLSPQDIATAIEQGQAGKTLQKKCPASGDNGFDIAVEGPIGRIMRAAGDAKRQHREFTVTDVTPALGGPFLTVIARRDSTLVAPYAGSAADIARGYRADVAISSKSPGPKGPILLKPIGPITYDRPGGSRMKLVPGAGTDMSAAFDLAEVSAVPPGDIEVVIFATDAGERRCKISDKERQTIR